MRLIAVDPGLTTGLAYYNTNVGDFHAFQTQSVVEAENWIVDRWSWTEPDVFIVEDFISAGHLTKQAKHTIKLLGYFEYWFRSDHEKKVVIQVPQKRLSSVEEATKMCMNKAIEGPHSWDALAHALAYARDLT